MDGKKLGGIGGTLLLIGLVVWLRMSNRSDDSEDVKMIAMILVMGMDDYDKNKAIINPMADRAHTTAFDKAYTMGARRRRSTFDDEKYLDAFFESMVNQANQMGRQDIKASIIKLRNLTEEDDPVETADAETGSDAGGVTATPEEPASDAGGESTEEAVATDSASPWLSREEFDAAADDAILDELYGRISSHVEAAEGDKSAALKKLTKGQRMIYVTSHVNAEVKNGGFQAFFDSPSGTHTKSAVPAFTLVGAKKHATIMRRAIAVYARSNTDQEVFEVDKTVKGYLKKYKKDKSLKSVDKDYQALKDDLHAMRVTFVREHAEEFVKE